MSGWSPGLTSDLAIQILRGSYTERLGWALALGAVTRVFWMLFGFRSG